MFALANELAKAARKVNENTVILEKREGKKFSGLGKVCYIPEIIYDKENIIR